MRSLAIATSCMGLALSGKAISKIDTPTIALPCPSLAQSLRVLTWQGLGECLWS